MKKNDDKTDIFLGNPEKEEVPRNPEKSIVKYEHSRDEDLLVVKKHREVAHWKIALLFAIPIMALYLYAIINVQNRLVIVVPSILFMLVFYVGALSLDLELGSVGLPNFGKVAFFAIGAYASTLLYGAGLSFPIAVVLALIISGFFGWLLSIPTVKLREDYFAIMTIAGGEVIRFLIQNEKRYLWQPDVNGIPQGLITNKFRSDFSSATGLNTILIDDPILGTLYTWEFIVLIVFIALAAICYFIVELIRNSPYGRTLRSIRDDDIAVISVGKDVARFRWQMAVMAAIMCGLAGVMYGFTFTSFEADNFRPPITFLLFVYIIIGGLGNSRGAFVGTGLVTLYTYAAQIDVVRKSISLRLSPETPVIGELFKLLQLDILVNPDNTRTLVLGLILLIFLLYMPEGLIPEPKGDNERYLKLLTPEERARSDEAVLRGQSLGERERLAAQTGDG